MRPALFLALALTLLALACGEAAEGPPTETAPGESVGLLAFSFGGDVYTVRPDGSGLQRALAGELASYSSPAFSPDGQHVAYIIDRRRVLVATSDFSTTLSDVDLFVDRPPAPGGTSNFSMGPVAVHWSPDGELLLVTRQRLGGSGISDVVVMDSDGSGQRVVLETSFFIEAAWSQPGPPPQEPSGLTVATPRILVVAGDDGLSGLAYDERGNRIGPVLPFRAIRYAVVTLQRPKSGDVLVRSTLGSPEPFGPIELVGEAGSRIIVGGCGATWSPDGDLIAYYDGFGLAIKSPDSLPDDRRLVVSNEQLGLPSSDQARTAVCGGLGISWSAETAIYRADHVPFQFAYPAAWVEGAPNVPYRSCSNCVVFGPAEAEHPYGVRVSMAPLQHGCTVRCYHGDIGRVEEGRIQQFVLAGREASQARILHVPPLGLTNETGDATPYHEVWTMLHVGDAALLLSAFYREGDAEAEQETLAAYEEMLLSLRFE